MKRIYKLFLMGAIALGMVACSNDDVPMPKAEEGNTYASVTLRLAMGANTRALPNDYNDIGNWAGNDIINNVAIFVVGEDGVVSTGQYEAGDFTKSESEGAIILTPKKAIKTTAGEKTIYALINGTPEVVRVLATANADNFKNAYETAPLKLSNSEASTPVETSASKLAKVDTDKDKDLIVMTNTKEVTLAVADGVTEVDARDGKANRASVQVERAVARVMVTIANATEFEVKRNITEEVIGTVSGITWVLAQGENSLYIQRKDDWKTPSYAWVPGVTPNDYISKAGGLYDYSGLFENKTAENFGGTTVPTLSDYAALGGVTPAEQATTLGSLGLDANAVNGKFILPTTHKYGKTAEDSEYKKGNTAYVLIRAKFTPTKFADDETYTAGSDFFVGANGKFYTSAANAVDPAQGGVTGQTVAKYVGGKVLYYAWLNPDNVPNWLNSPVLRNNIYHIHITGFKNLGTNWNPLYPEDPDTKDPKNPDPKPNTKVEPNNPIDPNDPLTTPETWMSVDVKVLPWKVHSYSVDLGI